MKDENKKSSPVIRVLSLILILVYLALLGIFIYFMISGSEYLLAMLFVIIVYPIILYVFVWLKKVFGNKE
ncbi:MAG: hypothetical protein K6E27_14750 [Eubacterium sp.]|nr:hypothetical protein [Eubacterium sp.]